MNKDLKCPACCSSNINYNFDFTNKRQEYNKDMIITLRNKICMCECLKCGHKYNVDFGCEKYTFFIKPKEINNFNDIKLVSEYESDFDRNYKIYCSSTYPYEELTYFALVDGLELPIILSKKIIDEVVQNQDKTYSLIKNLSLVYKK